MNKNSFDDSQIQNRQITLYVPYGSKSAYEATGYYNEIFAKIVEMKPAFVNGADITDDIGWGNLSFENSSLSPWIFESSKGEITTGGAFECYDGADEDLYQNVWLPAGTYRLECQGYYRCGSAWEDDPHSYYYKDNWEDNAMLYASTTYDTGTSFTFKTPLMPRLFQKQTEQLYWGPQESDSNWPGWDMSDAYYDYGSNGSGWGPVSVPGSLVWFAAGKYQPYDDGTVKYNTVTFFLEEAGFVRIGVKKSKARSLDAFVVTNFKMYKVNDENIIEFADAEVKRICVENWDTSGDGKLSAAEAAAVISLGDVFKGNTTITSFDELQFFTGLTAICDSTFRGCSNMTSVTLPEGLVTIGKYAFYSSGLTSIKFPTTLTEVKDHAFGYCTNLTTINFTNCCATFNAECFQSCTSLEDLYVPNTVKFSGWNIFWGCSSLKTAIFEAFEEGQEKWSVTGLFSADYFTSKLETVVLPATSVITRDWVQDCFCFFDCNNLKSVTFLQDDVPATNTYHYIRNFKGNVPEDVLFIVPEGTAENFLKRGYKNVSDKSGLPLVRAEFEAEANRITAMANTLTDGEKNILANSITAARNTVNTTEDYMTVYAQIAAIKDAAKTYLATATLTQDFDVTAAYITNPNFDRFDIGWTLSSQFADNTGYYNNGDQYYYTNGNVTIENFVEAWSHTLLNDGRIEQTITNLPAGRYRLECDAIASWQDNANVEVTGVNLFAGTEMTPVATENRMPEHFTVSFENGETQDVTIGIDISNSTANWVVMDNVRLYVDENIIEFADAEVKRICVENWDTSGDGELSAAEAAAVTSFGDVFQYNDSIKSFDELQFFTGLTSIGGLAFYGCGGLTSVTIPNSVTSIGEDAFENCI